MLHTVPLLDPLARLLGHLLGRPSGIFWDTTGPAWVGHETDPNGSRVLRLGRLELVVDPGHQPVRRIWPLV